MSKKIQIEMVATSGHELIKFDPNKRDDVKRVSEAIMEKIIKSWVMYGIPKGKADGEFEKIIDIQGISNPKNPSVAEKKLIETKVEDLTRILLEEPKPGSQTTFYEPTSIKLVAPHGRG